MSIPAEELLDIRDLARQVMASGGWSRDGASVAAAVEKFKRRVPRTQIPQVYDALVALLMRDILREHDDGERVVKLRVPFPQPGAAPPEAPRPQNAPEVNGAILWETTESPGFAEPTPIVPAPVRPSAPGTAAPAADASAPGTAEMTEAAPASPPPAEDQDGPAAPVPAPRWLSPVAQAAHGLWPELGTTVEVGPGRRKVLMDCSPADMLWRVEHFLLRKQRHLDLAAEDGKAQERAQQIHAEQVAHGGVRVRDLPDEVKDRLFQRRAP